MGVVFMTIWAICKNGLLPNGPKWADSEIIGYRVTELQSHRHPRVFSIPVGEIFLCLTSINFPTRFARKGINLPFSIGRV